MPREPRGEPSSAQLGHRGDGPREPRPVNPMVPVQLVTADDVEESIASMCRIFGTFVTEGVLGQYRDVLEGLPPRAVLDGVKRWIRKPPEDRAARPHELRALAERHVQEQPELTRRREEPPPPKQDLDRIFAELAEENPTNPMYQWIMSRRQRARAEGQELDAEQTAALLSGQAIRGDMFAGKGTRAHQAGTHEDWRSTNVPADEHP
jgi:hypothetical protein